MDFFNLKKIFSIEPMLETAVRLPDSLVKPDVSLNMAELQNHFGPLILGSWGPFGNTGGKGQCLSLLLMRQ